MTPEQSVSFDAMAGPLNLPAKALFGSDSTPDDWRKRLFLFLPWLLLVAWPLTHHVFWRDEVRAFSLALSGSSVTEMLRNIHGEGHPALWYLLLRAMHDLLPVRAVLPITGAAIGIAAMALFAFRAPFRLAIIALVLFSLFGVFEYVVVARNYGISALVMFVTAALYPRVKSTAWFGILLLILCNTNVPSCILAAAFVLFRFVELLRCDERARRDDWLMLFVNGSIALLGALICFETVYPPLNDGVISSNFGVLSGSRVAAALGGGQGFSNLVLNLHGWAPPILLWSSCLAFVRKPGALAGAFAALLGLKLFFYFVYPSGYRHEALFVVFMISLMWMTIEGAGGSWRLKPWMTYSRWIGAAAFVLLLSAQVADLAKPLYRQMIGIPFSRSADVARLLNRPSLYGAIVMADPDVALEPLPYYADNRLWFLREQRFGRLFFNTRPNRQTISLDTVLADMKRLHDQTSRPIVFLSQAELSLVAPKQINPMYRDWTVLAPESVRRFRASTRLIARLRPAITDEAYDVYVYPR